MNGHANLSPHSSPPAALYLPRSQAQISQTGKAPATPMAIPKPQPTTTTTTESGKRKAKEPMATAATKKQKIAPPPPPFKDPEVEKSRLFAILCKHHGSTLTHEQIYRDVDLMYWYKWDHRRYTPYIGSREEGNCPMAKAIIPGLFPALPIERAVPILPTQRTVNNQINAEERERVQNENIQRAIMERQRAEMAALNNPQGFTSQTWFSSRPNTQASFPPQRNADQGSVRQDLFIAQEHQASVSPGPRTHTKASDQRQGNSPQASPIYQAAQIPWAPQNTIYTPHPTAMPQPISQAPRVPQNGMYTPRASASPQLSAIPRPQAPWVYQNGMYNSQPSSIPRSVSQTPQVPQNVMYTPQPSPIPRPMLQAPYITQENRNAAKPLSTPQPAQPAPVPQKYTYTPAQGYVLQASFVSCLPQERVSQMSSTVLSATSRQSQSSPSSAHASTNNTPSLTVSSVSQPTTPITSAASQFQPAISLVSKQREQAAVSAAPQIQSAVPITTKQGEQAIAAAAPQIQPDVTLATKKSGDPIADEAEIKVDMMIKRIKHIRSYPNKEQSDEQEAEILKSIQECHKDIKRIKSCWYPLEYHLRSLGVREGILKHMNKMSTSLTYVESNFKDKSLVKEVVIALDEVDAELTWMKTSLNSVYQWCQCSACVQYYIFD